MCDNEYSALLIKFNPFGVRIKEEERMIEREVANQKTGWNEAHVNVDSKFLKKWHGARKGEWIWKVKMRNLDVGEKGE